MDFIYTICECKKYSWKSPESFENKEHIYLFWQQGHGLGNFEFWTQHRKTQGAWRLRQGTRPAFSR